MDRRHMLASLAVAMSGGCLRLQGEEATETAGTSSSTDDATEGAASGTSLTEAAEDTTTTSSPESTESDTTNQIELRKKWSTPLRVITPHNQQLFGGVGSRRFAKADSTGNVQWRTKELPSNQSVDSPTLTEDLFIGPSFYNKNSGTPHGLLSVFDRDDRSMIWQHEAENRTTGTIEVTDSIVYYSSNSWGSSSDQYPIIYALEKETGELLWTHGDNKGRVTAITEVRDGILVGHYNNDSFLYARDGSIVNRHEKVINGSLLRKGNAFVFRTDAGVECYDFNSNRQLWKNTEVNFSSALTTMNALVIGGTSDGAEAIDIESGNRVWATPLEAKVKNQRPTILNGLVWVSDAAGKIYGLNVTDGRVAYEGAQPSSPRTKNITKLNSWLLVDGTANSIVKP